MMKRRVLALFLFVILLLTGCGKRPADAPSPGEELVQETPAEPPAEKPNIPFRFYQPLISNFAEETPMYK